MASFKERNTPAKLFELFDNTNASPRHCLLKSEKGSNIFSLREGEGLQILWCNQTEKKIFSCLWKFESL